MSSNTQGRVARFEPRQLDPTQPNQAVRRLPKGKGYWGRRLNSRPVCIPTKPGGKHHPNDSINGDQERSNLLFALSLLSRCQPDATDGKDALKSQRLWESQRIG
jgi:hypothetical protein